MTVGAKQCGFLLLMRGQKGSDKIRYNYYCDNILLPFVQQSRMEFGGWEYGTPIPHNLKAVSWCDGDLAQIENIVSTDSLNKYKENMICANKQNAARSGVEQAADLTRTFKIMKRLQETVSCIDIPMINHPLKRIMMTKFEQLTRSGRLGLKPMKKDSIIDFISSIPEMTVKAATKRNIVHGFCENGMIDNKIGMYPDFNQMLGTC